VWVPGPLRILVVLASPEGDDGGPLLDVERELAAILDAVEPARKHGRAYVRVLNLGTLAAVREALTVERFHVLHVCCHASPHRLVLEDDRGRPDEVTARRLLDAIPAGRRPAVVVLAGCSTALSAQASSDASAAALPGLARELLAAGVPQVVAMTAPVSDRYAALFGGRLYRELALAAEPSLVTALPRARRQVEAYRRGLPPGSPDASLVEWATPALFVRGEPLSLYDPTAPAEPVTATPEPVLPAGVPLRPVGDFVGRRAELRALLSVLRRRGHAGVVVHGIGGVGKSSLAAELLRLLGDDAGLIVPVVGAATADQVLVGYGQALFTAALTNGLPDDHPLRRLAAYLRTPSEPWRDRLATACGMLADQPVTLLVDNFESNLDPRPDGPAAVRDEALAEFLAAWAADPGPHRLLVTSRYPFTLPEDAHRRLTAHHLGPLSLAETRKLIWRLPGLDALRPEQQQRAWTDVGGHPRTLEYLDALLRRGEARFSDVTRRLEGLLAQRGIADPGRWITDLHADDPAGSARGAGAASDEADTDGSGDAGGEADAGGARGADPGGVGGSDPGGLFGRALAEAVTLAVNDTLLADLLGLLDEDALALLVGAAVYREPADELALAWQVAAPAPVPADPERDERRRHLVEAMRAARAAGKPTDPDRLGYSPGELAQLEADRAAVSRPPLATVTVPDALLAPLRTLGLLAPVAGPDDDPDTVRHVVHRWTAAALARLHPEATTAAHARAAAYFGWRLSYRPQDLLADLYDQIEARHHHHAAGDLDEAIDVSYAVGDQLHTWSAWGWEAAICRETLTWLPADSHHAAAFIHQLGIIAQARGDYTEAERRYHQALTINEELGNRAGVASGYGQLGRLAYDRGDLDEAERRYRQSLTIDEELGNRADAARNYHNLGMIAHARGDLDEAERRYRQSLTIKTDLGNRAGAGRSYHQLGILAHDRRDLDEAERRYRQSLAIDEELGNRAGIATSYGQLGILAHDRGDLDEAERRYRQALAIREGLGDRAGSANSYGQLGILAHDRRDHAEAERRYQQALTVFEELGDRANAAISLGRLGQLREETGRPREAVALHVRALALRLGSGVPAAGHDARRLRELRAALGADAFNAATELDRESLGNLNALLDGLDADEAGG
jgi:tetratricopeptide (TPR) repeat protein